MKQGANATAGHGAGELIRTALLIAVLAVLLAVFITQFALSYRDLSQSIELERVDYVSEIARMIITNQRFMKNEYLGIVENYAGTLMSGENNTLADARKHFINKNSASIFLVSSRGRIIDLDGNAVFMTDRSLSQSLGKASGVATQLFASLDNNEDYWLFTAPLTGINIQGEEYAAVVLAVSANEFRDNLSVSLFDNRGASYIIKRNGSISIQPGSGALFGGYNLFSSMLDAGADENDIDELRLEMDENATGYRLLDIYGERWLISYSSLSDQDARDENSDSIVVAIPLTITAAQTYDGLTNTIVFAVLVVLTMASIAMIIVLAFLRRDRERERQAMAVAAKSDFFSKMSHDIRTPLNAIIGMEMLAKDSVKDPEAVCDYLTKSMSSANYLLSIINDVLDMSRIESGKFTVASSPFDMNALISDVQNIIAPTAAEKQLTFGVTVDEPFTCMYMGDQVRVKQVIVNLMSNAVKFTKPGGRISLIVSHKDAAAGRDEVTIIAADTGIGMSEEYLPRVFLPFEQEHSSYTQQYNGSGLGLAIVKNLVTVMGGAIEVTSRLGEGSSFTVKLPFARGGPVADSAPAEADERVSFAGMRALVAEDNEVNRQVIITILKRKFEMTSDVAVNGKEALEMFSSSPENHYDVILMDVKMPVMDGLDATRAIRALDRLDAARVPIIALSANAFEEDVGLSLHAGMNDHLAKPLNMRALSAALRKHILGGEVS